MALRNDINAQTKNDIISFTSAVDGQAYILLGESVMGDTPVRVYYYDASSSATADGENILMATGMGVGRFIKNILQGAVTTLTNTGTSGAATYTPSTGAMNIPNYAVAAAASINNAPGRALVSVANAANGYQISSTRNVFVNYTITIGTTASIAANASGTVVLEVAATNSATPADWTEISRITNGQALSLAITLQSVQTYASNLSAMIGAGQFVRQRTINNSGTPSFTAGAQQEILL